jgi:hypothetical protein
MYLPIPEPLLITDRIQCVRHLLECQEHINLSYIIQLGLLLYSQAQITLSIQKELTKCYITHTSHYVIFLTR